MISANIENGAPETDRPNVTATFHMKIVHLADMEIINWHFWFSMIHF